VEARGRLRRHRGGALYRQEGEWVAVEGKNDHLAGRGTITGKKMGVSFRSTQGEGRLRLSGRETYKGEGRTGEGPRKKGDDVHLLGVKKSGPQTDG